MALETNYATTTRIERRKGVDGTQEFFTPSSLVSKMCDKIPSADWSNPTKTFLEPCFGNGNFLVLFILTVKNKKEISSIHLKQILWSTMLEKLFGPEQE